MYKRCIELEISSSDKASLAHARKLFESALATYSEDISLWQDYYSIEIKVITELDWIGLDSIFMNCLSSLEVC